jgi:YidC/Oxa1 family membrane protein insertase
MDNVRLFLFFALALILMLIWQAWERETTPPPPAVPAAPAAGEVPRAPATRDSAPANKASSPALTSAERIQVVTDVFQATIDTEGGDLRELLLRRYPVSIDKPGEPLRLMSDSGADIYVAQSGLIGLDGAYPSHKARYTAEAARYVLAEKQNELRVPLYFRAPDGVRYTKTHIFRRGSYAVDVEFTVANGTKREWSGYLYGQFRRTHAEQGGFFNVAPSYIGGAIYTPENKYEKIAFADMTGKPLKRDTTGGWAAMLQHYFVGAWLPQATERSQFYSDVINGTHYVIGYKNLTPTTVAPGRTGSLHARFYAGPKEQRRLELLSCAEGDLAAASCKPNGEKYSTGMDLTVDYGWLTVISAPLFWLLELIYRFVGNWGWAIVILTFFIKLAFYPLSAASYKSMAHMKQLTPKLQALKERYGDDKQKLNQAMMELYKTEKINPLGGCLPILIQIPVFIALYWVLLESVEMRQAPWVLWIKDLSAQDPYYVLPIVMGVTMYAQQLLNPQPVDPIQKKVFMVMPAAFTAMFLFFPTGLVLYWTVNNILSIAQQWRINQVIGAKPA